jgi:glycosyltransferase involved in cell wall biosynthesis
MAEVADLTVVIPHLDAPEALACCLASLAAERNRSGLNIAAIVVDNGSARRPEVVCAAHDFVRLLDEPEPGPGPARNRGTRLVETEIVAFLDGDCYALPGWATAILGFFRAHPETSVIGGDVRIACVDPNRPTAIEAYESVYGYRFWLYVSRDHYTGTGNMAVRRAAFSQVGDFAGIHIAEDVDWGHRATRLGHRIDYVPEMAVETPARDSFAQLARKWDRHIGHELAKVEGGAWRLPWGLRALALAASPIPETLRILRSDRITGLRQRGLAWTCLTRIRLYRCGRMLGLLAGAGRSSAAAWRGGG